MTAGSAEVEPSPASAALGRPAGLVRLTGWLAPVIVLVLAARAVNPFPVGAVPDEAVYVVLGKALATGQGYRYLNLPGAPAATHFPPGYPALIALLWRMAPTFPANVLLFKLVNALLVALVAVGVAQWARRRFDCSPMAASVFAVVSAAAVPMLVLSALVMSEPLFLALLVPVLLVAERAVDGRGPAAADARLAAFAGLLAGALTLVRGLGLALVAAVVMALLARRRVRDALLAGSAALLVMLPWQWWVHMNATAVPAPIRGTYGPYGAWLADGWRLGGAAFVAGTVRGTVGQVAALLATLAAPSAPRAVVPLALGALLALAAAGAWRMWRAARVSALFLGFYVAIVLVWPYAPARFLWGIWPLLLALPLLGVVALWRWCPAGRGARVLRACVLAVAALPAMGYTVYTVKGYRGSWWANIPRQRGATLRAVVLGVKEYATPTATLSAEDDAAIYLYTGHPAVPFYSFSATDFSHPPTITEGAGMLRAILAAYAIDDVVVTTSDQRDIAQTLVAQHPPELALRDSFPGGLVYSPIPR